MLLWYMCRGGVDGGMVDNKGNKGERYTIDKRRGKKAKKISLASIIHRHAEVVDDSAGSVSAG